MNSTLKVYLYCIVHLYAHGVDMKEMFVGLDWACAEYLARKKAKSSYLSITSFFWSSAYIGTALVYCGQETEYGDIRISENLFRLWLVA